MDPARQSWFILRVVVISTGLFEDLLGSRSVILGNVSSDHTHRTNEQPDHLRDRLL